MIHSIVLLCIYAQGGICQIEAINRGQLPEARIPRKHRGLTFRDTDALISQMNRRI